MNIKNWILENLPQDAKIIEAGTADGWDTMWFSKKFPNGIIYGFEPIPKLYQNTVNNLKKIPYQNTHLFELALSDKTGKASIWVSDRFGSEWGSSSLLEPKEHLDVHTEITFREVININTVNLDEWCKLNKIDYIDLMWLDMQGYEPIVIKNSPNIVKNTKYIYSEVSLIETYDGVIKYPEFRKFMESIGFEVIGEELPWQDMGNVLFRNKEY